MNALFLTESYIDLHHHLTLANSLKGSLDIIFLVKPSAFRAVLWERGYSSFLYSELFTSDIRHSIDRWWERENLKDFQNVSYKGYRLWNYTEFERKLLSHKMLQDYFQWTGQKEETPRLNNIGGIYKYAACLIEGFSKLLAFLKPQGVFIWNGLFLPTRVCAEVAKMSGAKVYFSEEAYFPQTMIIDEEGVNAASCLCGEKWNEIAQKELSEAELNELNRFLDIFHSRGLSRVERGKKLNRAEVYSQIGIPSDKKIVFYPAQVEVDTNTILFSPNYRGNKDVIKEITGVISRYSQYHLVVKVHPREEGEADEYRKILGDSGTVVGGMNIHSLIEASDIIMVTNTTVGLEALTYYKPVIVLGKAIYSGKGFTFDVSGRDELDAVFRKVVEKPFLSQKMKDSLQKFLLHLINEYLYYIEDNDFTRKRNKVIEQRIISELKYRKLKIAAVQFDSSYFLKILKRQEKKKLLSLYLRERSEQRWQRVSEGKDVKNILLIRYSNAGIFEGAFNALSRLFPQAKLDLLFSSSNADNRGIEKYKALEGVRVFFKEDKSQLFKLACRKHDLVILSADNFYGISRKGVLFSALCRSANRFVFDRYQERSSLVGHFPLSILK